MLKLTSSDWLKYFLFFLLSFAYSAWAANECSNPDTGWMKAGSSAAAVIEEAVLSNCEDDPSWDCVKKNTAAIDKAKDICRQCDSESFKQFCISIAEDGAKKALEKINTVKQDNDRKAREDEQAERIAKQNEQGTADKEKKVDDAKRPACHPFCEDKDFLPPPKMLPVDKAEIKGLRIRMSEAEALKVLNSKSLILSPNPKTEPSQKVLVCGVRFKSLCDFSIAGERPFSAALLFYGGILRQVVFVISHPNDANEKNSLGSEQRANFVVGTYEKILNAFVEKFDIPIQDKPHYTAPGSTVEVKTYESENVWIFGDDAVVINLNKSGSGNLLNQQINIEFFDKKWQIEEKQKAKEEKSQKLQKEKQRDLNKRT